MRKIGVMEYWSTGVMGPEDLAWGRKDAFLFPILQHSNTPIQPS
jgi:hypothetical protein